MSKFWAEELAREVIDRHKPPYVVSDWKTPSGHVHVGALRGVLLHDAAARTISESDQQVRYIFGFDDYDSLDKIPDYLGEDYQQYLGQPFSTIPAPDSDGNPRKEVSETNNYGKFYADEFEQVYRVLGVSSETLRTSKLYAEGFFNPAIEVALSEADKVKAAYEKVITNRTEGRSPTPFAKYPINMVCSNCRKIATTEATDWDGQEVSYVCRGNNFAAGCGHQGKSSPYDGAAKLPWKVEWAAKFFLLRTDLEGGGKDHYTKGGSRDVANEVFKSVYLSKLPTEYGKLPVDLFYEWVLIEGKKMATSKGLGDSAASVVEVLPADVLRFLLVRSKPKTAFSFKLDKESILKLYDQFDQYLRKYHSEPTSPESKAFKLSIIANEVPQFTLKMSSLIYLLQLPNIDLTKVATKDKGGELTNTEEAELKRRVKVAKTLIDQLQPKERIRLQESLPSIDLNLEQKSS